MRINLYQQCGILKIEQSLASQRNDYEKQKSTLEQIQTVLLDRLNLSASQKAGILHCIQIFV
jgi:hypothetical protein